MDTKPSSPLLTRAEQETQAEAQRLRTQIEAALAAVTMRSGDDTDDLDGHAARIERAARDLAVALRELSRERQQQNSHY
jgi:hypothetical protein